MELAVLSTEDAEVLQSSAEDLPATQPALLNPKSHRQTNNQPDKVTIKHLAMDKTLKLRG